MYLLIVFKYKEGRVNYFKGMRLMINNLIKFHLLRDKQIMSIRNKNC